ncbi:site-specific integrase [Mesorhizobium sp. WSM4887]|uniref:site-specific integrase n=1 Tax=Mesorhizobium sp. WSM4887 TaxID=3038543 RepID=UPI002416BCD1|nr:site-specific integrase [Mesorhizobium sp. WSM4887]MDG4887298.1 site-specific integrase [Mesorhizobium sp. WSM4887]
MRNPTYLEISRHRVFYFRWPLIKPCAAGSGTATSLKISLGTRVGSEALSLARHLSYVGQALMKQWSASGMRYDEIRASLRKHFQELLARRKSEMAAQGRLSVMHVGALQNGVGFAEEAIATGADILPHISDDALAIEFAEKYCLPLAPGSNAFETFKVEMRKAYRAFCAEVLAHDQSFESYDFDETAIPSASTFAKPASGPRHTLADAAAEFMAELHRSDAWVKRTEDQKRQHLELLSEILPGIHIDQVTSVDLQRVKQVLLNYPRNRNKVEATKNLSIDELLQLHGHDKLSVRTINSYLQTYAGLFSWAKRNRYVSENLFDGASVKESKKQAEAAQREAFSQTQTDLILSELLNNHRGLINKDYQKWGPLIGLYTGARLNEICQIELSDIKEDAGIWYFDINDEGDKKHLKNTASRRIVPIHDQLLALGFLEYAEGLRARGQKRLFPEFSLSAKEGYGRALGRWFNDRFLVQLGIKSKELVFHSFRHGMVTRLIQAGVEENLVKAIVGHTRQGVTQQHYFKEGYTLEQMQKALREF